MGGSYAGLTSSSSRNFLLLAAAVVHQLLALLPVAA
jgi:hypothetical protein